MGVFRTLVEKVTVVGNGTGVEETCNPPSGDRNGGIMRACEVSCKGGFRSLGIIMKWNFKNLACLTHYAMCLSKALIPHHAYL
ncbi:hypothetical protein Bca4012_095232 [Brassica carinata]